MKIEDIINEIRLAEDARGEFISMLPIYDMFEHDNRYFDSKLRDYLWFDQRENE